MTVFKGFLILLKRNALSVSLYFIIFVVMALVAQFAMGNDTQTNVFKSNTIRIAIADKDQSTLSKQLVSYLKKTQTVRTDLDISTPDAIQENMYYENAYCVIKIPKGFEREYLDKQVPLTVISKPGFESLYVTNQVNNFLNHVNILHKSGYSVSEAIQKVQKYENEPSKLTLLSKNKSGGELPFHNYLFQLLPYILISMTGYSLGIILIIYAEPNTKRRMLCSPVSYRSMNLQLLLGAAMIGIVLWLTCGLVLPIGLSAKTFLVDPNSPYYLINVALMLLNALAFSFLMSKLIRQIHIISSIVNVVGLGTSFLCGVFVPLELLSAPVKTFAQFIPVYWYEVTNELLGYHSTFSANQKVELFKGFGIQLLFVIAFLSVAMLVGKLREQEN